MCGGDRGDIDGQLQECLVFFFCLVVSNALRTFSESSFQRIPLCICEARMSGCAKFTSNCSVDFYTSNTSSKPDCADIAIA